jgi:hypothetical protein
MPSLSQFTQIRSDESKRRRASLPSLAFLVEVVVQSESPTGRRQTSARFIPRRTGDKDGGRLAVPLLALARYRRLRTSGLSMVFDIHTLPCLKLDFRLALCSKDSSAVWKQTNKPPVPARPGRQRAGQTDAGVSTPVFIPTLGVRPLPAHVFLRHRRVAPLTSGSWGSRCVPSRTRPRRSP